LNFLPCQGGPAFLLDDSGRYGNRRWSWPTMETRKIIRRILWMMYACPIALLVLLTDVSGVSQRGFTVLPYVTLDFLLSFLSIVAIFLHIWDAKLFVQTFWKIYAFVFLVWDLLYNLFLHPAVAGENLGSSDLFGAVIVLPLYVAIFRYAFRNWKGIEN
jgi:hypothetical protein